METLFAVLALTVAVAGFFGLHLSLLRKNAFSGRITAGLALGQRVMEETLALPTLSAGTTTLNQGVYTVRSTVSSNAAARGFLIDVQVQWGTPDGRTNRVALSNLAPSS